MQATQILARRSIRTLAKGESLTLTTDMFSDLVPGTGGVSLSVSLSTALDAATILKALDRYPHGCSEQITSRVMPLLYVNDLAAGGFIAEQRNVVLVGGTGLYLRALTEGLFAGPARSIQWRTRDRKSVV